VIDQAVLPLGLVLPLSGIVISIGVGVALGTALRNSPVSRERLGPPTNDHPALYTWRRGLAIAGGIVTVGLVLILLGL
jgi:hypothetical protein